MIQLCIYLQVCDQLTENDVPGAKLDTSRLDHYGRKALVRWLECRGDIVKGCRTKAELIKRLVLVIYYLYSLS